MTTFAVLLLVLVFLAQLALLAVHWRAHRRLKGLAATTARLAGELPSPPALPPLWLKRNPRITVEILNPAELAAREHPLGGTLASLAPALVRKLVQEQALRILRDELVKYGVKAELSVHDA